MYTKRIIGGIVGAIVLIIALIVLIGTDLGKAAANEWGCQYGGGPLESHGLKETIPPGKSSAGIFDTYKYIPADDRIYAIDSDPNTVDFGGSPIVAPARGTATDTEGNLNSQGLVNVQIEVQARFVIDENACDLYQNNLKKFDVDGGLNFNGSDAKKIGGWAKFLNVQLNQSLISILRPLVQDKTYVELYSNTSTDGVSIYDSIEKDASTKLTTELQTSLGATYFCGPAYAFDGKVDGKLDGTGCPPIEITIKKITPVNPALITNLETIVNNQEQLKVINSEQQKKTAQTEADKVAALAVTAANKETALATTSANQETSLAQTAADQATQLAATAKDQEIANAQSALFKTQTDNKVVQAQAETAFCRLLEESGTDCAAYFRAINWKPVTIIGGSTDGVIVDAATGG